MGTGTGETDAAAAAARLRLIETEFITPRRHPGDAAARGTRPTHAPAPVDLGTLDYMRTAVDEVIAHTRTVAPHAGPAPADAPAVYGWMREHNAHAEHDEQRRAGEAIVYRQGLEHALAVGDETVVRRLPCPACGCWGLFWRPAARRAACVNRKCTDPTGGANTFSLAHLAQQHIAARNTAARRAT